MHDSSWAGEDDRCAENPVHCDEGLSFSIWEKITYDSNVLVDRDNRVQERKYIVSSGGDYDPVAGTGMMEEITCAMRAFQLKINKFSLIKFFRLQVYLLQSTFSKLQIRLF